MNKRSIEKLVQKLIRLSCSKGKPEPKKVKEVVMSISSLPFPKSVLILETYKKRLQALIEQNTLVLESAKELSKEEANSLTAWAKKNHNFSWTTKKVSPNLLAGVRVKTDSVVYDTSIQAKLNQLKEVAING